MLGKENIEMGSDGAEGNYGNARFYITGEARSTSTSPIPAGAIACGRCLGALGHTCLHWAGLETISSKPAWDNVDVV